MLRKFNASIILSEITPKIFERVILSVLILVTIIVFCPTLHNGWQTAWDDQWFVTGNLFVLNPTYSNLKLLFTKFYYGQYAPLNVLFCSVNQKLFGFNATIFHGACLIII